MFTRLSSVRAAYSSAFGEHSVNVDGALASQALDALAALRNCIAHRAGKVDKEYEDRTVYLTVLPKAPVGQPVHLDGKVIGAVVPPALECGAKLVTAVDGWIAAHP